MGGLGDLFGIGDDIYVSPPPPGWNPDTDPPGSGTLADPYHLIATGITKAAGGRNVYLRGGQYIESVAVSGISGKRYNKIVVQPFQNEIVTIDSCVPDFFTPTEQAQWKEVDDGEDEFIWTQPFGDTEAEQVTRGAFMDLNQHTRLITYSHLEDLRAETEVFPKSLPSGDNRVWVEVEDNDPDTHLKEESQPPAYRNWVYMGPGIWFDKRPGHRQVHVRLSHTHNNINGWPDYTGITDPRRVKLALSKDLTHALLLLNCKHIRFKNLIMRFGGHDTIRLRNCCGIEFDYVNIRAGSRAIRLETDANEQNKKIVFKHCEVDGGTPTWFFRSDRKDGYFFGPDDDPDAPQDQVQENTLGAGTTGVLISSRHGASKVQIHHCMIFNGHDVYVFGDHMRFHHNWVHNINDDALNMGSDEAGTNNAWIYRNVVTQCLTALSFAARPRVGQVRIFRNLIDIREPTLGIRPEQLGDNPFRQGQFYKNGGLEGEGPFDLWHNTCLVLNAGARVVDRELVDLTNAAFTHYKEFESEIGFSDRRRAYNNIFVAAYPSEGTTMPIAFLPPNTFQGPTDGNTYERVGPENLTVPRFDVTGDTHPVPDIDEYIDKYQPWENQGRRENPQFLSLAANGQPQPGDDLRLQADSPAKNAAVPMPGDMRTIERLAGGILALFFGRDRGCYWTSWDRMWVGVGGKERFPT